MQLKHKSIVVFRGSEGNLGNQLFHLAALDTLCASRRIGILYSNFKFRSIIRLEQRGVFIFNRGYNRLSRQLDYLEKSRLVSNYTEELVKTEFGVIPTAQLIPSPGSASPVVLVSNAFLQSDRWVRQDFTRRLSFQPAITADAVRFGVDNSIDWETTIFVHVRRGDYLTWTLLGTTNQTLPDTYYRAGIDHLRAQMAVSKILFITDDRSYVKEAFSDIRRRIVASTTPPLDLCLMSKCASGVLSASSFSWWGATLGKQRVPPVAPLHWLGWKRQVSYPAAAPSSRFFHISVS